MIHKSKGTIEWLEFNLLADDPHIRHGVFLRKGGVSKEPHLSSLNVVMGIGDDLSHVQENRKRIRETLDLSHLVSTRQVHGSDVVHVTNPLFDYPPHDGLMTSEKDIGLLIVHADCQAALFYDPIHKAVASVHAGWRGQVKNIYKETIEKMKRAFGSNEEEILVCISPSLGPEHSEFIHYQKELPEEFWDFQVRPYYFDLWEISRYQLLQCGILPHHIEIAEMSTYSDPEMFFSYRREKHAGRVSQITGGHGTVIGLV